MKRVFAVIAMLLAVFSVSAASMISQPAATVNLIRNSVITVEDLNAEVERFRNAGMQNVTAQDVLQTMINDEVFIQGAERDGIVINDRQIDSLYKQVFNNAVQQAALAGQTVTEDQFQAEVIRQFGSIENYRESLKNQQILNMYLMQERGEELQNVTEPSESDIQSFFRQNQQTFFQPEAVKLSHIYMEKTGDADADAAKKVELEDVSSKISSGEITFEKAVQEYSEDDPSRGNGGEIGWLTVNNAQARQGWGDAFCDAVLMLDAGDISPVLESNTGYHIVKVSVHSMGKLLGLNDPVSPEDPTTVHDYIYQVLYTRNSQIAASQALESLLAELRGEARINILYKGN